ncbi:MAG: hypothetical protein WCR74_01425 [Betaproteobacteria bacterium]
MEIERISSGTIYIIKVDAYRNEVEKQIFEAWMLTAKTYGIPQDWIAILKEAWYTVNYFWKVLDPGPG